MTFVETMLKDLEPVLLPLLETQLKNMVATKIKAYIPAAEQADVTALVDDLFKVADDVIAGKITLPSLVVAPAPAAPAE